MMPICFNVVVSGGVTGAVGGGWCHRPFITTGNQYG
jgi:hypothetical protein